MQTAKRLPGHDTQPVEIEDRALAEIMFDFWTARLRKELMLPNPDSFAIAQINKRLDELRGSVSQAA